MGAAFTAENKAEVVVVGGRACDRDRRAGGAQRSSLLRASTIQVAPRKATANRVSMSQ
jgi:hypothetical protein